MTAKTTDVTIRMGRETRLVQITVLYDNEQAGPCEVKILLALMAHATKNGGSLAMKVTGPVTWSFAPIKAFEAICGQPIDQPEEK